MKKSIFSITAIFIFITSLIVGTLYLHNKIQLERQAWKPLIRVDKNIPEILTFRVVLFYKSNDNVCGLTVLTEVSNEDREGAAITKNILILIDKQLLKFDWHEINFTELQAKRNYALTIIHSKDKSIEISIKVNDKMYRKMYDAENSDFITSEVFARLFGVEV